MNLDAELHLQTFGSPITDMISVQMAQAPSSCTHASESQSIVSPANLQRTNTKGTNVRRVIWLVEASCTFSFRLARYLKCLWRHCLEATFILIQLW